MKKIKLIWILLSVLAIATGGLAYSIYLNYYSPKLSSSTTPVETISPPIVIFGDTRTGHQVHQKIVDDILSIKPLAVFNTGDLVEDGSKQDQWDIFNQIESGLINSTNYYAVLGNHDKESQLFFDNFILPNNERWYSVDIEKIHFIVLDSEAGLTNQSEQYVWLTNDLKNIPKETKFNVLVMHVPLYSVGEHKSDEKKWAEILEPLINQYGIKVVFSGHDHAYERFDVNGVTHIITGGGGAPLYDQKYQSPYLKKFIKDYNFCELRIIGDTLIIRTYDLDLKIVDRIRISK